MPLSTLDSFSFNHVDQVDKLYEGKTSAQIKALLDSRGVDLQTKLNLIVNILKGVTDGDSGADNVGVTPIAGLTGNTTQAVLESLKAYVTTQLQGITQGQVADNSLGETKMASDMKKQAGGVAKYNDLGDITTLITDYKSNAVSAINEVKGQISPHLADSIYQVAGGSGTAITLTISEALVTGLPITFIASANNSGGATTINSIPVYKPGTTNAPNFISGKAYTVWYNSATPSFFIKASAEGNTIASHVLAGETFSNDLDTGIIGTAPLKTGITYTPTTTDQIISAGFEDGTCKVKGDANFIASNINYNVSMWGVTGTGKKYGIGDIVPSGQIQATSRISASFPVALSVTVPILTDSSGNLYMLGSDNYIYKYSSSLAQLWKSASTYSITDWCIGSDGNIYAVASSNYCLYIINPSTGAVTTTSSWTSGYGYAAYVYHIGGNIYVGTNASYLIRYTIGGSFSYLSVAGNPTSICSDGIYIFYAVSTTIYKLSISTFTGPTSYITTTNNIASKNQICDSNGNLFILDPSAGTLKKYNSSGTLQWTKTTASMNIGSVRYVQLDSSNYIYIGAQTNVGSVATVVKLDNTTGNVVWQFNSATINVSSTSVSSGGKVFMIDYNTSNWTLVPSTYTVVS